MRYRDNPTVEVEQRVEGDPAAIWALVTDITLPARVSSELQEVVWLNGATGVEVGNRFQGKNRHESLGEWATECVVVEVEPERRWVWEVHGPEGVMARWGFEVDPGRSAVTVRQFARMGPAPSGLSIAIEAMPDKESRIISHRMAEWRENITANLVAVRDLIEQGD